MYKNRTDRAILYYTCYKYYKPRPVIRSMYELTFTFRLADLVRYEVRSKQRSDHPLVIQCLVTERLVTERSHYTFSRITKRSMYDTYVRNDNVNALYIIQPQLHLSYKNKQGQSYIFFLFWCFFFFGGGGGHKLISCGVKGRMKKRRLYQCCGLRH